MKAKQYADQFMAELNTAKTEEDINQAAVNLVIQLNKEVEDLKEQRHIKFDRGFIPICKELNQKWNAIVSIIEKRTGQQVLKENGYRDFLFRRIHGLKEAWTK